MRKGSALAALVTAVVATTSAAPASPLVVRAWLFRYRAHDGVERRGYVVLPGWYGPRDHPALPLVISPHGRGLDALQNTAIWGDLPGVRRFALVSADGQGRRLELYSWGDPGQIRDLARMPKIVRRVFPWLRIERRRIYAFGGSMGGQEVLLLLARHPRLLAGVAAFDAPTSLARRYRAFRRLKSGERLQDLLREEVGGTPRADPRGYAARSPLDLVRRIAFSGVPLQIWWSRRDRIVSDGSRESGLLYREIEKLNPRAPVIEFVGRWRHQAEMRASRQLPRALRLFGL